MYEGLHNAAAFERAGEFDVLSNQFDFLPLTYSRLVSTPVVTTVHGFSSERIVPVYRAYDDIAHYVAISDADRHPDLTYAATIHHGIDLSPFTFRDQPGDYLLFLGRIHPDKGTHRAIAVARRAGLPLVIAGIVQDEDYFRALVQPHLGAAGISYVGPVGPAERDALLGGALALLHLIGFAEPFGLSVVESLATGTPVIAYPLGSMPEIIRPGRTGFLVDDLDGRGRGGRRGRRAVATALPGRRRGALHRSPHGGGLRGVVRPRRRRRPVGGQPLEEQRQRHDGEPDGRVARPVGQQQLVAVPQRAAGVDDVGDVAVALVRRRAPAAGRGSAPRTRLGSSRSSSMAPIEYSRIGPTPWVSTSQPPRSRWATRSCRSASAPRRLGVCSCAGVAPPDAVGGRGDGCCSPGPSGTGRGTGRRPGGGTGPCPCSGRPGRRAGTSRKRRKSGSR